ncbi:TonB-dependent receptor [Sunxiuqinia elliptica]
MKKNELNGLSLRKNLRKALRIMKLTTVLLLVFVFQTFAVVGYAQRTQLTLNMKNTSVEDALYEIEQQSDYVFLYNRDLIDVSRKSNLKVKNAKIETVLTQLFEDTNVGYQIIDRQVVLSVKSVLQQNRMVTGKVTDSSGQSLPGVTVVVKGTTRGTISDFEGNYAIDNVPADGVLVFSFVGMRTQEIVIGNQMRFNVTMAEDAIGIEEVVAVGYGTQKKINLTGAVAHISSEDIENKPVTSVGEALQGVIPNLNVSVSDGSPGTTPKFNIRGGTSFGKKPNSNDLEFKLGEPLVLVDGVEMDLNQLNPEDIESVSVLKDAASAAIYGARAAYGVMLVTTKKGGDGGKTRFNYSNSFQWKSPTAVPDLLDAYTIEYARIKAVELENKTPSSDALLKRDKVRAYMDNPGTEPIYYMNSGGHIVWVGNTDVYGEALQDFSPTQQHNLSVSGGTAKTGYYGSIGYQQQDGIYRINTDKSKRYNVMLNLNSEVNSWLSMDLKTSYSNWSYQEPVKPAGKGGWWIAMSQNPERNINMPIKTPEDSPVGEMYTDNILSFMDYGSSNQTKKETTVLSSSVTINPLKNWNIKGEASYKSYNYNRKQAIPLLTRIEFKWDAPTTVHTDPSSITRYYTHTNQYTLNAFTDYSFTVDKHNAYMLVGFNQEWYEYDYLMGKGEDILTPNIPFISQTLGNEYASDAASEWALRGGFYRIKYDYEGKYLLESNGRYDGTSRFPKDSRFKFFASFSGAWRVSSEPFAEFMKPVVNDLKLRASYGSLGNQNVSNYLYIPSYGSIAEVKHMFGGMRPMGVTPPGLVDPDLTWETATTVDFGADITVFDKLAVNFDWYQRKTRDILVAGDKFPAVVGTGAPTKNSGELTTKGWDMTIQWNDKLSNGLRYNVSLVLSDYQTEITKFGGNPNKLLSGLYEGQMMGEIWGFETEGIFQSQEEIDVAPDQSDISSGIWYPGDVRYKNLDEDDTKIGYGSSTVDDPGDRKIIGNSTPRYRFGINSNLAFKNFDLNIFLQGVAKRDYWISNKLFWGQIASGTGTWEVYNNSWTPDRRDALYPAYKAKGANIQPQTRFLQNAAYMRIKNVTIGYTLPVSVLQKLEISKLRVYASGNNLFSFSKLPDVYDPELLSADYPILRTYAIGFQLTF